MRRLAQRRVFSVTYIAGAVAAGAWLSGWWL